LVGAAISEKSGLVSHTPSNGDSGIDSGFFDNMTENIAIANMLGMLVGLFTLALGFFRLGFLDSVLSRALLRGFVTAVGKSIKNVYGHCF
jgi:MFS superfamily sulfate permease-like transporter